MKRNLVKEPTTWSEEIVVGGRQLVAVIERLVAEGNVRRLIVMKADGKVLFETSVTTGAAVAGVFTILAPMLTAIGALAALFAQVRVKIVYIGDPPRS